MSPRPMKLVGCRALEPILAPMAERCSEATFLDIGLHLQPDRLRERLNQTLSEVDEEGVDILLGYGLCGRALEGVASGKSRLILPRVDDCVGALLGSRDRHREVLNRHPGCYFLSPHWLSTELNIFEQLYKDMERIPPESRERILKLALKHYKVLALLSGREPAPEALARCRELAEKHDLGLMGLETDLGLLTRLMNGPWDDGEFVVVPAGQPIPLF